jgi:hypothetical protein
MPVSPRLEPATNLEQSLEKFQAPCLEPVLFGMRAGIKSLVSLAEISYK